MIAKYMRNMLEKYDKLVDELNRLGIEVEEKDSLIGGLTGEDYPSHIRLIDPTKAATEFFSTKDVHEFIKLAGLFLEGVNFKKKLRKRKNDA